MSFVCFFVAIVLGTQMRAVLLERPTGGNFSSLGVSKVTIPTPGPLEALIKVYASSVNPVDWKITEASNPAMKLPKILGSDASGVVVSVGKLCSRLQPNDEVWMDLAATVGLQIELGSYAEYATARCEQVGLKPKSLNFTAAATLPLVALTSLQAFQKSGGPWKSKNVSVLITSGSGGTGFVGVQIAKALGANFVATSTSTEHVDFVKNLGADLVIDYKKQSIWNVIPPDSIDVVYDNLGLSGTADKAMDVLKEDGYFVYIIGSGAKNPPKDIKQIHFLTDALHYQDLDTLREFVDNGKLKPYIQETFPLEQVGDAFDLSSKGHVVGKLAIQVASP